jgi:RNA polymerase sigma-70 factor (ECF subfamily)
VSAPKVHGTEATDPGEHLLRVARDYYPECPEALIVSLARDGDDAAFEELVRRRQSSIRNLMRRFCGDSNLADDLAQQVFLKMWTSLKALRKADAFGGWLKKIAVSVWLQHLRKHDALRNANELEEADAGSRDATTKVIDLDAALSVLSPAVRSCIVLSYHEGMSHDEISRVMELPIGTVKSHIKRGSEKLRHLLAAYQDNSNREQ